MRVWGKKHTVALLMAGTLLLSACGAGGGSAPAAGSGAGGGSGSTGAEENKLVIYTARSNVFEYVIPKFEEKYPEYKGNVQVLNMGAQEILERVRAEKGNPQADFWWGGTQQALAQAAEEGLLEPAPSSVVEKVPEQYRDPQGRWVGEILLPEVIMYNTDALKPEEAPQDWDDLLDPKWKGKIVIRAVPASGTMRTIYSAMIYRQYKAQGSVEAGYDWLRRLDANTKEYVPDPTTLYLKLARQEALVSLWNLQDIMIQRETKGLPFGYVMPASGAPVLVDGVALIKGAKHPEAAKKFMEFLFDEDVQLDLAANMYQIPTLANLDPAKMPKWLAELDLKPMDLDWKMMGEKEQEWIQYWDQNIKGKGGQ
ncbi:extracellular solute-binding protein family 1 [Thermaerobacter marianensis DSM 12885]|uniref:Extracellular solute-binding protein family 1 n=1 Tax=Thermaerobacter marianensis (strain ATCC 700841 / DSM 12885 / JCM 10246 / 7p75a) TaxID=644966 RepID=E6SI45_THEM7|nr:extracellular solute-binding protein [Thermaerobacter marianensis]ADU50823.1 extracellular solute-binding protein family 1 [Thermaerobacter marianensis DSM 12885]